jgi:hypothetical protein
VVGRNALIVHDFERPVNVTGFDKKLANIQATTVTAVVAYNVGRNDPFDNKSSDLHPNAGTQPALPDADGVE